MSNPTPEHKHEWRIAGPEGGHIARCFACRKELIAIEVRARLNALEALHPETVEEIEKRGQLPANANFRFELDKKRADRITACVNALAGLDPEAFKSLYGAVRTLVRRKPDYLDWDEFIADNKVYLSDWLDNLKEALDNLEAKNG